MSAGRDRLLALALWWGASLAMGCTPTDPATVHVLAAISLQTPLEAIYEKEAEAGNVTLNFASSSTLARQIVHGAPADIYVTADATWVAWLHERRGAAVETAAVAGNRIELVAPKGSQLVWNVDSDIPLAECFQGRLATGDPEHVPLGRHARSYLEERGAWESLSSRIAPARDARAALALVESGQCPIGIVYATDAMASSRVQRVAELPSSGFPYVGVLLSDDDATRVVWQKLKSPESFHEFGRLGFLDSTLKRRLPIRADRP